MRTKIAGRKILIKIYQAIEKPPASTQAAFRLKQLQERRLNLLETDYTSKNCKVNKIFGPSANHFEKKKWKKAYYLRYK